MRAIWLRGWSSSRWHANSGVQISVLLMKQRPYEVRQPVHSAPLTQEETSAQGTTRRDPKRESKIPDGSTLETEIPGPRAASQVSVTAVCRATHSRQSLFGRGWLKIIIGEKRIIRGLLPSATRHPHSRLSKHEN
jgi:hypothetical protein